MKADRRTQKIEKKKQKEKQKSNRKAIFLLQQEISKKGKRRIKRNA